MNSLKGKVILITGASSGIGQALADYLSSKGYRVYGTSRNPQNNNTSAHLDSNNGFLKMIQLNVCDEESVKRAIDSIVNSEGRIDVLINNAGFIMAGAIAELSVDESKNQFETNFFGVHRMCRYVIPNMRQQGTGLIINVSSVAGLISIPFQSMYSASKYALEALSEALRMEVKQLGIKVTLIEPGDTKTGFTNNRQFAAASNKSVYGERFTNSVNAMIKSELNSPGPEKVVKTVSRIIEMKNPPVRVVVGFSYKTVAFLKRILPSRVIEYIVMKLY